MRSELISLRKQRGLSQVMAAEQLGLKRCRLAQVEIGRNDGTIGFWRSVKDGYNVPSEKMWSLIDGGAGSADEKE